MSHQNNLFVCAFARALFFPVIKAHPCQSLVAILLILAVPASAEWKIIEKPGELRVANGRIGVVLTREANQASDITLLAADKDGKWHEVCRTLRQDFTKTPDSNKIFDTPATPHRYQANNLITEFSLASRSDRQVKIKMSGQVEDRVVAEQTLTLDHDGTSLHKEISASLHQPLLDYFLSFREFLPLGAPDFVHSPTDKKDGAGPAVDQVIGDHAFHSPTIGHKKGGLFACDVPTTGA